MKKARITQFSIDGIIDNWKVTLGFILLFVLLMVLTNVVLFLDMKTDKESSVINNSFGLNSDEKVWNISWNWNFDELTRDEWDDLKNTACGDMIDNISAISDIKRNAFYSIGIVPEIDDRISKKQNKHKLLMYDYTDIYEPEKCTEVIYANYELIEFFNLKLTDVIKTSNNEERFIILGPNFRDEFNAGDEINIHGNVYKIVAFLEEEQHIPVSSMTDVDVINDIRLANLDYAVIIGDTDLICSGYIVTDSNCNMDKLNDIVKSKLGSAFTIESFFDMSNTLLQYSNKYKNTLDNLKKAMVNMLIFSTTMCMCFQLLEIDQRKRKYGILYANGYSKRDIGCILFMETMLKTLFSGIIAYLVFFACMGRICKINGVNQIMLLQNYISLFAVIDLVICVCYSLLISVIPIVVLYNMSASQMMKG